MPQPSARPMAESGVSALASRGNAAITPASGGRHDDRIGGPQAGEDGAGGVVKVGSFLAAGEYDQFESQHLRGAVAATLSVEPTDDLRIRPGYAPACCNFERPIRLISNP